MKNTKISKRAREVQASPIRKLLPYAVAAKKKGKKVYHLNIGQPDIETPQVMYDAITANKSKILAYGPSQGLPEYQDVLVDYYNKNGFDVDVDDVIVTTGGSEAIVFAMMGVGDPGDEIIIPEPFYTNYNGFAKMAGINIIPLTTHAENGFHLPERKEIEKIITHKTKAIMICNPNNPTGTVYGKKELEMIIDIAKENNLFVIADEVYREFIYDGLEHISVMTFKNALQRIIVTDSISKRFSACGARLGAIVSKNKELMSAILKFAQARLCPPTLEQIGAIELHKLEKMYFRNTISEYQKRRDIVFEALKNIDGVVCEKPEGAFYVIAKLPINDAEHFAKWLLTDFDIDGETVMIAPAQGFYATPNIGLNEIRIAYILNIKKLKRAMEILTIAIEKYNK